MYTIYRLNADDLDDNFVQSLKALFKNKQIEIAVSEVSQVEEDETDYLLSHPANRKYLLKSIENISKGENLVTVDLEKLQYCRL